MWRCSPSTSLSPSPSRSQFYLRLLLACTFLVIVCASPLAMTTVDSVPGAARPRSGMKADVNEFARRLAPVHRSHGMLSAQVRLQHHQGKNNGTNGTDNHTYSGGSNRNSFNCDTQLAETVAKWTGSGDGSCEALMSELAQPEPSVAHLCNSSCWRSFLVEVDQLFSHGCIDVDADDLDSQCRLGGEGVQCDSPPAVRCVDDWLAAGCPEEDDELFARCAAFAQCALHAKEQGRCPAPSETAQRSRTCARLRNCSNHGDCVDGHCRCHKGWGRASAAAPQDC